MTWGIFKVTQKFLMTDAGVSSGSAWGTFSDTARKKTRTGTLFIAQLHIFHPSKGRAKTSDKTIMWGWSENLCLHWVHARMHAQGYWCKNSKGNSATVISLQLCNHENLNALLILDFWCGVLWLHLSCSFFWGTAFIFALNWRICWERVITCL